MATYDMGDGKKTEWLLDLYRTLSSVRKCTVLIDALNIMERYNGNGQRIVISEAMYDNLSVSEKRKFDRKFKE